jgi:hypothetical protein
MVALFFLSRSLSHFVCLKNDLFRHFLIVKTTKSVAFSCFIATTSVPKVDEAQFNCLFFLKKKKNVMQVLVIAQKTTFFSIVCKLQFKNLGKWGISYVLSCRKL